MNIYVHYNVMDQPSPNPNPEQYFDELRTLLPCGADSKFDKNTILQNIYIQIYTYIHTCIYIYIDIDIDIDIDIYIYICEYIYIHIYK